MISLVTIACILPIVLIFIFALPIIGCSSKKEESKAGREGGGKKDEPAVQQQSTPTPRSIPAATPSSIPTVPAEKKPNEKEVNKEIEPKKGTAATGGGGGGDEEEGGYESCPDMTPEQLAKIANESPPK
ncbi:unnamed protein product [Cercopithifilaria johnstoni]|uniref:Uncharacterized protein n=1 Tax=Cercopithifilaria johnstoni TaxID=2874296 RepID=A0A8J2LR63_9BILA|nr:unnamed protein product [Cercopithifilaria johnstoni]